MENGFQGKEGQSIPEMPASFVKEVSERYIQLYEHIVGEKFVPSSTEDIHGRINKNVLGYLNSIN